MKQCVINHVNGGTSLTDESNIHPLPLKNSFWQIGYVYYWHFNAIFNIFKTLMCLKKNLQLIFKFWSCIHLMKFNLEVMCLHVVCWYWILSSSWVLCSGGSSHLLPLPFVAANHVFKLLIFFFQVMFMGRISIMKTNCLRI